MNPHSCPSCGVLLRPDDPHGLCPACLVKRALSPETIGGEVERVCHACRAVLEEDARFCAQCGAAAQAGAASEGDPVRKSLEAKLAGQYRIVRLLGRGGMGSVYLARDLSLDREVAIKVVKTAGESVELRDRLRREAKTAAKLSHPNVVPLHAFGEVEGMPYFVMGYVRGESLAMRLARDGRLDEDEARRLLAEVADALDHAHRQGVVHRDVKPDNVLLEDESGRALLTDFGIAKALGRNETMTSAGSVLGTPDYMSPEQAAGRAGVDGRSDIYSLGVMGYAMLAGRLPFEGKTPGDVLRKHLTEEPPPLRPFAPSASDATVLAVMRCLSKEPENRWPDARSLKLALGKVEESPLPDSLQNLAGRGMPFVALLAAYDLWMYKVIGDLGSLIGVTICEVVAGVVIHAWLLSRLAREGIPKAEARRAIWREPSWWPFWYPRALRRPGNVWDRLPSGVRLVRAWIFVCPAFTLAALWDPQPRRMGPWFTGWAVLVVLWPMLYARAKRLLVREGLTPADASRVMISMPPSRVDFFRRPHIESVLAPVDEPESRSRAASPHDQLQSILRNAGELSGPLRPLGAQAASAARQLLVAIDEADREIGDLARNVEADEEERVAGRIEALGHDAEHAPMRQLLEKQIELIRDLKRRIAEAQARRGRRVEMLKTLALHIAALKARSSEPSTEVRSLSDRVRSLCEDIGGQGGGVSETAPTVGVTSAK